MKLELQIKKLMSQEVVTRNELQQIACNIIEQEKVTFLNFATGVGKSGCVFKACSDKTKTVLVSHNQSIHKENMIKDAEKLNININHFTHILWNSYHKLEGKHFDYVVIDEFDYALDTHISFLKTITYDKLILLTGTVTKSQLYTINKELNPFIFRVTLANAISWGILPEPMLYLKLVEFDNKVKEFYPNVLERKDKNGKKKNIQIIKSFTATEKEASKLYDEAMEFIQKKLKHETELLTEELVFNKSKILLEREYTGEILFEKLKILQSNYYKKIKYYKDKFKEIEVQELDLVSPLNEKLLNEINVNILQKEASYKVYHMSNWTFKNQLLIGGLRKKFYEKIKIKEFEKGNYFNRLKDKRCIFFLDSVELCEKLGNSITYKSSKKNQETIDKFNEGFIDFLTTKKIIDRAMSVDNIEYGLITTFDFSGSATKQKFGRLLRSIGIPKIVMFICKGTKEEKLFYEHFTNYGGKIQYI